MKNICTLICLLVLITQASTFRVYKDTQIKPDTNKAALRLTENELLHRVWTLLHSFAAAYPKEPNNDQKLAFVGLVNSYKILIPIQSYRETYSNLLSTTEIKAENRDDAVMSVCYFHNNVNSYLGKEIFNCDNAFDFWGGGCGCSANTKNELTEQTESTEPSAKSS